MARDVHQTLLECVRIQGNLSEEDAGHQVQDWMSEHRYLRDIWS
jgi:sulfite reductase alpha subunit-like flavoprotein